MAKYLVNVGGFVTVYRERKLVIHANNEEEAKEKAEEKFIELQQAYPGNMCGEGTINSIELLN